MKQDMKMLQDYLIRLGLDPYIANIYFSLHTRGPQTISQLARNSKIERTRIYRLLDEAQESGLIEVEKKYKSNVLRAASISNLQILFSKKEQDLARLQEELPQIEQLLIKSKISTEPTRIEFYHGPDGAKQLLWNETKATTDIVGIMDEVIQIKTDEKFFERWVEKCNQRKIKFRSVVGDNFLNSKETWYTSHTNEQLRNWRGRYISKTEFPIGHSTIVYDKVTAFFNWDDQEIYGIEIHNQEIANTQRNFFEKIWNQAKPLPSENR